LIWTLAMIILTRLVLYICKWKYLHAKHFSVLTKHHTMRHIPCLIKHNAMKAYGGDGGVALHIHNLRIRWRSVVSFIPQQKSLLYPLDRSLGGPHSQSGCGGKGKNIPSCPCWELSTPLTILSFSNSSLSVPRMVEII
jgi:hypothetical protein